MASTIDYKNWEKLAASEEAEEKARIEKEREQRRIKHFMEQARAKKEFEEKQKAENPHHHDHEHHHGAHDHSHDHSHEHSHENQPKADGAPIDTYRPRCGCGYMSPEDIKALQNAKPVPQVPVEEKNKKKRAAVDAAKLHGGQLFKDGDFQQALAVYERGVLIMNGMIELSDAEMDELALLESVFNSNMSACCLKLNEHKKAYDYARLALNLDAKNSKAVYRKAQAQFGMSDFDGARQTCENALKKQESADFRKLLSEIVAKNEQQLAKQRQCEKEMAQRMSEKLKVSA